MKQTLEEFFHEFRQELMADAEANSHFSLNSFCETISNELIETGFSEGFNFCHFNTGRGIRVDGYWFDDEGRLDLVIADYSQRDNLETLTKTEVHTILNRLTKFLTKCLNTKLYEDLEETSPEYGLSREIYDRKNAIQSIKFFVYSERALSGRMDAIDDVEIEGIKCSHQIWDISRLHKQKISKSHKEKLEIKLEEFGSDGLACLPAHLNSDDYQAYLIVIPATILAKFYEEYDSRLLEQNVRCFLQARGNVNKGIKSTIINEPSMFFAYNNGITATAENIEIENTTHGLIIKSITDLQIVNGGQTTASLFHTSKKDKASLEGIFVQMKLSVIDKEQSEVMVPKISEYANTQNKVNAADFFSNAPFHVRIEEFSRRLWAPAKKGELRDTKWFYERARGQYADAQSSLTTSEKKKFKAEQPKSQMFTKTDLAKFENVWSKTPQTVNFGAQKNFTFFAKRIGNEWKKSPDSFNESYYKKAIAKAIIFRQTEKIVSTQPWYGGGYRANIVAYSLALIAHFCMKAGKNVDFLKIWNTQEVPDSMIRAIEITSKIVHDEITNPPQGISNVTEWCKKTLCWEKISNHHTELADKLPEEFLSSLIEENEEIEEKKEAIKTQKIDNGIEAQKEVISISSAKWARILNESQNKNLVTDKEVGILKIATQIPQKIPTEKQSVILLEILQKLEPEGIRA